MLSAVVFSVYIGFGNTLELSVAYTAMTFFAIIKGPLRFLPSFVGQLIEFLISMKRIQIFLCCQEINASIVHNLDFEQT